MIEIYHQLEKLGHKPITHKIMFRIADGTDEEVIEAKNRGEHFRMKQKYNLIKWWYNSIKKSDAIIVCNFDKKGIKNYIGGNTLMEMGFAHVLNKKVFLLNPPPTDVSYTDEIKAMVTLVLNGDLSEIK